MTSFTLKPDKNSGHDPDDASPAHCGPRPEYDGMREPVAIYDREEADGDD
jgi:hypothetical protein